MSKSKNNKFNKKIPEQAKPTLNTAKVQDPKLITPSVKKSKITEFAQTPSYIIATLVITLIGGMGGIPGLFQLISYFSDKPILKFHQYTLYVDKLNNSDLASVMIISGVINNDGEKPLFIKGAFDLILETPDHNVLVTKSAYLSNTVTIKDTDAKIDFKDVKDLQTINRLIPSEPIPCSAIFKVKTNGLTIINPDTKYTLICHDLNGKRYSDTFHFDVSRPLGGVVVPQVNITYTPETKTNDTLQKK